MTAHNTPAVYAPGSDWRRLLLAALGAPVSAANIDALEWWAQSEGMPDGANNWLATTQGGHGGRQYNTVGVKGYPSIADGVAATAETLRNGLYGDVIRALRDDRGLRPVWEAVNASPWCHGCQGGRYPVVLYDHLSGAAPSTAPMASPSHPLPPARNATDRNPDYSPKVRRAGAAMAARAPHIKRFAAHIIDHGRRPFRA